MCVGSGFDLVTSAGQGFWQSRSGGRHPLGHAHQPGSRNWLRRTVQATRQARHLAITPESNITSIPQSGTATVSRPRSTVFSAERIDSSGSVCIDRGQAAPLAVAVPADRNRLGVLVIEPGPPQRFADIVRQVCEPTVDFERSVRCVNDPSNQMRMPEDGHVSSPVSDAEGGVRPRMDANLAVFRPRFAGSLPA